MLNVLVFGGRNFKDYDLLSDRLDRLLRARDLSKVCIIEGGAAGADALGKLYAENRGIKTQSYPADWDNLDVPRCVVKTTRGGKKYNAVAGHNRNEVMGEVAHVGVGFWDGKSKGTYDMSRRLEKKGKRAVMIRY